MEKVHFYTKDNCMLCEEAKVHLWLLQDEYSFELIEHDIYKDDVLLETYHLRIPVVKIGRDELDCNHMSYDALEAFLDDHTARNADDQ